MNNNELLFSEEQLDFLNEMMNVGAGNAATAFAQLLNREVSIKIPILKTVASHEVAPAFIDPPALVTCARMELLGDVAGEVFFVVPDEYRKILIPLMQQAFPSQDADLGESNNLDSSIVAEIGNILTGVYLTTIHDFCNLDIYHSVPVTAVDMIQSLLDESVVKLSSQVATILLIQNEFIVEEKRITTYLLMIPALKSVEVLMGSIEEARNIMTGEAGNGQGEQFR